MINRNACFAYFNKSWGIPFDSVSFGLWPIGAILARWRCGKGELSQNEPIFGTTRID
jgi:hypothetical protein